MFKVGDLVYVSNPDTKYEEEYGVRMGIKKSKRLDNRRD